MKTKTLLLLPVVALIGFLAIKPPAVGTTATPVTSPQDGSAVNGISKSPLNNTDPAPTTNQEPASGSLTASSGTSSDAVMAQSPQPLSTSAANAPIAPPVIPGDDDDDDDDNADNDGEEEGEMI